MSAMARTFSRSMYGTDLPVLQPEPIVTYASLGPDGPVVTGSGSHGRRTRVPGDPGEAELVQAELTPDRGWKSAEPAGDVEAEHVLRGDRA